MPGLMVQEFDPEFHEIVETDTAKFFRRELGWDCLVVYRDRESQGWGIALHQGPNFMELALLGDGYGEGPWCSYENARRIIRRFRCLIPPSEVKKKTKERSRGLARDINDMAIRHQEMYRKHYSMLKRRHGEKAADEYALAVGAPDVMAGARNRGF